MDQYLSTVIIAIITGVFSVITIIIQKKQDKVISKIDEQTLFIEKENNLKQQLAKKESERDTIIHDIMILILDTNLDILKNSQIMGNFTMDHGVFDKSDDLKRKFTEITHEIEHLTHEYDVVLEMNSKLKHAVEKN